MMRVFAAVGLLALVSVACDEPSRSVSPVHLPGTAVNGDEGAVHFSSFTPLASSYACTVSGGNANAPLSLPAGYSQHNIASEPDYITNGDMQAWNITGPEVGRYLYR